MDELDLLKQDWKRKEQELPKLSYDDIHKMIWKRSSSIVKWIFVISILEFLFWGLISFTLKDSEGMEAYNSIKDLTLMKVLTYFGNAALFVFILLFFMNYRRISTIDNAKTLMKNILRTRKTVNYYVWFNLVYFVIFSFVIIFLEMNYDEQLIQLHDEFAAKGNETMFYTVIYGMSFIFVIIFAVVIWLFYRLIYGILLKKLNKNYKELKQIEV
ncbi:hypothetical protein SAMN05216480_10732 [Pustulibacterium marinum]|uniref:Uncharacterized protein n=1 Tax=Pustulibacterium marinum TaxID=1224947 RepID=A0A1I7H454_9FLAO|nr:hypothetical protein [Pustulibacterium marinum]SFU55453.1 hypothetical protein SAMN05216480_10732 [Pustulibacterium marinum]